MDIHHAMIVHNSPQRVYEALTDTGKLEVWMGAPVRGEAESGGLVEIKFDQRSLTLEIVWLEPGSQVQWRVIDSMWPMEGIDQPQIVTWTLEPYEVNTLVNFRMQGLPRDDGVYASVSLLLSHHPLRKQG